MSNKRIEIFGPLGFLLVGIWLLIIIPKNIPDAQLSVIGPRALPSFIAIAFIALSVILLLEFFIKHRKQKSTIEPKHDLTDSSDLVRTANISESQRDFSKDNSKRDTIRTILSFVLIFAYVLSFEKVGYLISTYVLTTLLLLLFRVKRPIYYFVVYVTNLVIYLAFTKLLFVMLP